MAAATFKSVTGGKVIDSANIKVYPCVSRAQGTDTNAQLSTEYNITNSRSGKTYVISKPSSGGTVKLSVGGYYFELTEITAGQISGELADSKYCNIKVSGGVLKDTVGSNNTLDYNSGSGDNYFYGLLFTDNAKTGTDWISLKFDQTKEVNLTYSDVGAAAASHTHDKSEVGLSNVGNYKAVSTAANQGLTNAEKTNARNNIGAGTSDLTLGTSSSTAAAGNHTHLYAGATTAGGAANSANKVNKALTFSDVSNANKTFDGSSALTVKPGNNITFTADGNDIKINATGDLSVDWKNGVSDKPTINSVSLKAGSEGTNTLADLGIQGVLTGTAAGTYGGTTTVPVVTVKQQGSNTVIDKIETASIAFPAVPTATDSVTGGFKTGAATPAMKKGDEYAKYPIIVENGIGKAVVKAVQNTCTEQLDLYEGAESGVQSGYLWLKRNKTLSIKASGYNRKISLYNDAGSTETTYITGGNTGAIYTNGAISGASLTTTGNITVKNGTTAKITLKNSNGDIDASGTIKAATFSTSSDGESTTITEGNITAAGTVGCQKLYISNTANSVSLKTVRFVFTYSGFSGIVQFLFPVAASTAVSTAAQVYTAMLAMGDKTYPATGGCANGTTVFPAVSITAGTTTNTFIISYINTDGRSTLLTSVSPSSATISTLYDSPLVASMS